MGEGTLTITQKHTIRASLQKTSQIILTTKYRLKITSALLSDCDRG